eukprot:scaffold2761_cov148-Isochrysis_galbana.AAC.2
MSDQSLAVRAETLPRPRPYPCPPPRPPPRPRAVLPRPRSVLPRPRCVLPTAADAKPRPATLPPPLPPAGAPGCCNSWRRERLGAPAEKECAGRAGVVRLTHRHASRANNCQRVCYGCTSRRDPGPSPSRADLATSALQPRLYKPGHLCEALRRTSHVALGHHHHVLDLGLLLKELNHLGVRKQTVRWHWGWAWRAEKSTARCAACDAPWSRAQAKCPAGPSPRRLLPLCPCAPSRLHIRQLHPDPRVDQDEHHLERRALAQVCSRELGPLLHRLLARKGEAVARHVDQIKRIGIAALANLEPA